MLSTVLQGVGDPAQLGLFVLAVPLASVLPNPSSLGGEVVQRGGGGGEA